MRFWETGGAAVVVEMMMWGGFEETSGFGGVVLRFEHGRPLLWFWESGRGSHEKEERVERGYSFYVGMNEC